MKTISKEHHERATLILRNVELVNARALDMEQSSKQFIDGEQAYQRLAQAKELDKLVNVSQNVALPAVGLKLNPAMHSLYLREIVENGGAPSIEELIMKVEEIRS